MLLAFSFLFFFLKFFWLCLAACRILAPQPRIELMPPAVVRKHGVLTIEHQRIPYFLGKEWPLKQLIFLEKKVSKMKQPKCPSMGSWLNIGADIQHIIIDWCRSVCNNMESATRHKVIPFLSSFFFKKLKINM